MAHNYVSPKIPFEIEWVTPLSPSCNQGYFLDTKPFRIGLKITSSLKHCKPDDFHVYLWTNFYHKENSEGEWHCIPAKFQGANQTKDNGVVLLLFGVDLLLTGLGTFQFTFKAKHKFDTVFKWSGEFEFDGVLTVKLPVRLYTTWIQEPMKNQITHNIYIGNFTAAMECTDHGFDCLLNMANDVNVFPEQFTKPIIYKRCLLPFGVENQISPEVVQKCVKWLRIMSDNCQKVMVCSRIGHARSGSILIAFIYCMNPDLNFEEAYAFVNRRSFVFPHKGLKDTVTNLYPRS